MKLNLNKYPYSVTAFLFLVVLVAGNIWLGWGQLALAYFGLLYCIVIIGIRLDEIVRQVRDLGVVQTTLLKESGNPGSFTQVAAEIRQLNGQLAEIKTLLARIQAALEK
ncbi:MAG: hypothetical protein GY703_06655, partial [Gammaproteobacteria bacterium]|nr:hypothetical protein [Gammaproteobacteria bacterium]